MVDKLFRRRLVYCIKVVKVNFRIILLIAFIVGCILGNEFSLKSDYWWLSIPFVGLLLFPKLSLVLLFLLFGFIRVEHSNNYDENHILSYINKEILISAEVLSYPQINNQNQILVLKPNNLSINNESHLIKSGLIQLTISKYLEVSKGDMLSIIGILQKPENFTDFDYIEYLKSQNIYGTIQNPKKIEVESHDSSSGLVVGRIRAKIISVINSSFFDPHAKLLAGMLVGTREQFSPSFANNLSITGTSHIVAVSGYNISLIIAAILRCAGFINRRSLIFLSFICISFFVLIVGSDNLPALRAGLMGGVTLFSMLIGRRGSGLFTLILVATLMHIENPFIYKSLSFQLSFAATYGLMSLSGHISKILSKIFPLKGLEEISTTLSAIIITFPITFPNFGKISIYALPANILIAPFIPLITFGGIIFLVLNEMSNTLSLFVKAILWSMLEIMIRIINVFASLPHSQIESAGSGYLVMVFTILVIVLLLFELDFKNYLEKND